MAKRITDIDRFVAKRLKAARLQSGLSTPRVAKPLRVTFQQMQKYENGSNRITAGKLAVLAALYRLPVGWFFEGAPIPEVRA